MRGYNDMASDRADSRPLSPHLQIWRWHPTMATSILHRATGIVNYVWVSALALWITYAAWSGDADFTALLSGWEAVIAYLLIFGALVSIAFHFFNGIRYLFWDSGKGFTPSLASKISLFNIIAGFGVGIAAFVWFLIASGAL